MIRLRHLVLYAGLVLLVAAGAVAASVKGPSLLYALAASGWGGALLGFIAEYALPDAAKSPRADC